MANSAMLEPSTKETTTQKEAMAQVVTIPKAVTPKSIVVTKDVRERLKEKNGIDEKYIVLPVYKAFQVLTMLSERGKLTVKEVYIDLDISKAQAFRYLQTLCASGFAEHDPDTGFYQLGLRSWELGQSTTRYAKLLELAMPHMESLRDRFNETINLGTMKGSNIIYLGMVESSHSLRMHATIGSVDPVYSTSLGKAMLAFYPEETWERYIPERLTARTYKTITSHQELLESLRLTRSRGYSLDDGENELGACCVGAPLFNKRGEVVAAISLSAPESRLQGGFLEEATKAVIATAHAISQRLYK
ncbi:MAG: IclR family transcriptional regulator [Trueperaceae bacterium]